MSWSQRAARPEQPPFQPPAQQNFGNQPNMYPNYQTSGPPGGQQVPPQPQQYWQQNPQYNQQYQQAYQQEYTNNANQFYQQPPQQQQYNQNYTNPNFANTNNQQNYQQGYYQNQSAQQGYPGNKPADRWDDNWDWGWDEQSKQAQNATANNTHNQLQPQPQPDQHVFNNANVIDESFASNDTWNWSIEDKKEPNDTLSKQEPPAEIPVHNTVHDNASNNQTNRNITDVAPTNNEELKTLNDREVVKEKLPNLALGKRFHLDNLTPQWSIESQMSQDSSDGPQTHSEGTYRSENQSRNSSKSSPGPNTDTCHFNYSNSALDDYPPSSEWSRRSNDEPSIVDHDHASSSRRESHDELSSSLQEMGLANKENPAPNVPQMNSEPSKNITEDKAPCMPPPSRSPSNYNVPPVSATLPPPPPVTAQNHPPVASPSASSLPPPPSSSAILPPPTNFPNSSNTNPFKQSGPFSHKKPHSSGSTSMLSFPPTSANLTSPSAVSKASLQRAPVGFGANLETTPDNSERPDQPQMSPFRPMPVPQPMPDNLEVAPQNDRNEYLQTAHLSSGDFGENTDFSCNIPPPGLRRMVVGQQEPEYSQNLNLSGDEPPPGLARMVPGQQTESDNNYSQSGDNYMDRHIDGQPTDVSSRPYRQADGQTTPENYNQLPPSRGQERRPIGLDRMVPGESSNNEYSQYHNTGYGSPNDQRVVMGVDHDYPVPGDAGPSDIREQNVDGSDYSEPAPRNIIGAREAINDITQDFPSADDQQRESIRDRENLQDLSIVSSVDMTYSREQTLQGSDLHSMDAGIDRKTDLSDSLDHVATSSRRQSLNRGSSGEESDRDKAFKSSPRRDRHKPSRDRERDRDRDRDRERDRDRDKEGRYSRGDRKHDRESERRSGRDDRRGDRERRDRDKDRDRRDRDRELSPDRRHRRSTRSHRYETEDTDYYSDRERERRRYREGSHTSKPPRGDERRRGEERSRRYNTVERDRARRHEHRTPRYRDIDPANKYGNAKKERDEEERQRGGEGYSSGSRAGSREGVPTDDDAADRRRDRHRHSTRHRDHYYDGYGSGGAGGYRSAYDAQRQYEYYETLRRTDPAAYMVLYKRLMAGQHPPYYHGLYRDGYGSVGYEGRGEERGSVHSGRSSTNGLKHNDTYYLSGGGRYLGDAASVSLRDAPSLRTDISDRDLNTDASLNLHLEDSTTVRSERMTPIKFSTAHVKGSIGSRHVVVVRPSYPVDGLPATVHILSLQAALAHDPITRELAAYPGPLIKGVTHKKSVMEYCAWRAAQSSARDHIGYSLLWDLLQLLLRHNGVVVGTDIAELLMKNKQEQEYSSHLPPNTHNGSRRGSSPCGLEEPRAASRDAHSPAIPPPATHNELLPGIDTMASNEKVDEKAAVDKLREYLTYGNRQDALEWAMSQGLWGHAWALSLHGDRRGRAAVSARFLAALPNTDPLHTLYAHLAAKPPPAATCVGDARWGDWRPHVAMMLSNASARPEHDRHTLTQLGDSLSSRGLLYSAQFCYISAGVQFSCHPLAPLAPGGVAGHTPGLPRLALLMADPRATTLPHLATNEAIFATEIYEYALSLNQDYVIKELQVYKLILAARLIDCGQYGRALSYVEQASRAVTMAPHEYHPDFISQLAQLAERLKYHEPALTEDPPLVDEGAEGEPSPRAEATWIDDIKALASHAQIDSQHVTPSHQYYNPALHNTMQHNQYSWGEQPQQQPQYPPQQPLDSEETPDYYHQQQADQQYGQVDQQYGQQEPQYTKPAEESSEQQQYSYADDWHSNSPPAPHATAPDVNTTYADPMYGWRTNSYTGYAEAADQRPMITMPGARQTAMGDLDDDRPPSTDQTDRETETPKSNQASKPKSEKNKEESKNSGGKSGGGWLGGILTKLSLRPPNQMILPDDKNPTIVWDAERKKWRNLDADEDEAETLPPPPPTTRDLMQQLPGLGQQQQGHNHQQQGFGQQQQSLSQQQQSYGQQQQNLSQQQQNFGQQQQSLSQQQQSFGQQQQSFGQQQQSIGQQPNFNQQQEQPPMQLPRPTQASTPQDPVPPATAPPVSNIFKMQKGRHIKKSYVDVFNPSGAATRPLPPAAEVLGPALPAGSALKPQLFVPPPMPRNKPVLLRIPLTPVSSRESSTSRSVKNDSDMYSGI